MFEYNDPSGLWLLLPAFLSFAVSAAAGPVIIPLLRRLKVGQTVRDDGPQTHLKKNGTPTMGGVIFLLGMTVTSLIYAGDSPRVIPVLFMTVGFGLVGFLDDYIKVVLHRADGLTPLQKMAGQFVVTAVFAYYMAESSDVGLSMLVPFCPGVSVHLKLWLSVPLLFFVVLGTVNGVNFTDGLDGLAASVTTLVAVFFTVVAVGMNAGIAPVTCAAAGGLLGFLLFNHYPAKVFMGDTGSLALGGFVAACAYMTRLPLFLPIVGFIYLIEVLSVILQVGYFKATHGRRLFKMAPIHHHFEKCGWPETRVVTAFSVVTALCCLLALAGL